MNFFLFVKTMSYIAQLNLIKMEIYLKQIKIDLLIELNKKLVIK